MPVDKELNIHHLIESQRGHHTASGNVYYWDVVNGDDANDGLSPTTAKQSWGGVSGVNSLVVAQNHDVVIILPGESGGITVITEQIVIDKEYTFVRGPGRDVRFKPTATSGETISVDEEGVELSGVRIETAATGDGEALVVNGDFCWIHDIWVELSQGDGIKLQNVSYAKVMDVFVRLCAGNGIVFRGTIKDAKWCTVSDSTILNNTGHGILFTGVNCQHNHVWGGGEGMVVMANGGWGIKEEDDANFNHIIGPVIHVDDNTLGQSQLIGSESTIENTTQWSTHTVPQVVDGVLDEDLSGHAISGSVGEALALAKKIYGIANANTEYAALTFDVNNRATQFRIIAYDTNDFGAGSGMTAVEVERWLFNVTYNDFTGVIETLTNKEGL